MTKRSDDMTVRLAKTQEGSAPLDSAETFSDVARWLDISQRLLDCARCIEGGHTSYLAEAMRSMYGFPNALKSRVQGVLLLLGFAAENAVKAAYLLDSPPILRGERIDLSATFPGKAHDLVAIAKQSILRGATEDPESCEHLKRFTQIIRWSGRYPFSPDVSEAAWLEVHAPTSDRLVSKWIEAVRDELARRQK